MAISDREWDQRILCSDGDCIGVVGADGCCKLCGKIYDGELSLIEDDAEQRDNPAEGLNDQGILDTEQADGHDSVSDNADSFNGAWENRILCVDENCIGVVGFDGRCKECGKPYSGKE